ncbi:hypothetical protein OKW24_005675 [Peribacillus simplex]|uniref:hypothetical protein n=1 Tax=Peribacillus simplex TaxID=1478 RepID=UPI0024E275E3|nr:hypothetical protein [Peribacillus simplex]MDF9763779.1 hypothetical protein [Peribacillus simplex]
MGWNDDGYNDDSYTGGMIGDSPRNRSKSSKTKIPHFRPIIKRGSVSPTEFGEMMAGLTVGMLFVFPLISFFIMSYPAVMFSILGIIGLIAWISYQRLTTALIVMGIVSIPGILGFLSLGIFKALLS